MPSRSWKRERFNEPWYPGETISVAIGQGAVSVTPMSLAVMMATVANGGTRVVPRLLKAMRDGDDWDRDGTASPVTPLWTCPTRRWRRSSVGCGWSSTTRAPGGSARIPGRDVMGKSGTAQVVSLTGRANAEGRRRRLPRPRLVRLRRASRRPPNRRRVVFAEHSDHGYLAAPIARHIIETHFAKQDGLPLPVLPSPAGVVTAGDGE